MKYSIITIHHIHNFGSVFQALALARFMNDNGYETDIIDYQPSYYNVGKSKLKTLIGRAMNLPAYLRRKKRFAEFIAQNSPLSHSRFADISALQAYYKDKDGVYISGGDQLWNDYHPCGKDDAYKLTFVRKGKKLAYGTSLGRNTYTEEEMACLAEKVKDFEAIMLREQSTVPLLQQHTAVPVHHVIDPVGLLDVDVFRELAIKPQINEPYAVMYLADSGPLLNKAIEVLSKKLGLKIVHICGFKKKCYCDVFEKAAGPAEILGYIMHADFVLSASFHATLFSILFNKQFATLLPGEKTNARIEDVLSYVGLSHRIVRSDEDLSCLTKQIEFSEVTSTVANWRKESRTLLLQTLEKL